MGEVHQPDYLIGRRDGYVPPNHGGDIAWDDPKIAFVADVCRGKSVLDLGCVQHDPGYAASRTWLHKAVCEAAGTAKGLDLLKEGVDALNAAGYDVVHGDAQGFDLGAQYDVIVAGDLIEHLHDFGGFFKSCDGNLAKDGTLVICTGNPWHWHKWLRAFFQPVPVNAEHSCWLCPITLDQVAMRFGFRVDRVVYGSSRWKDKAAPFPSRVRHANWYSTLKRA